MNIGEEEEIWEVEPVPDVEEAPVEPSPEPVEPTPVEEPVPA